MDKHGVSSEDKGAPTCPRGEVTPVGGARYTNSWSVVRNNANNAWYVNMGNGNMNNNNVNNRYVGVGVSELFEDVIMRYLDDEDICYQNKHDSYTAARVHYHLSDVYELAKHVENGTWEQGRAIVFSIAYPTRREVWAANYTDRILHHDVAPDLIDATERIHMRNGNVSHGNRLGHSAFTAALQIQRNMQERPDGYVGKRDLSGFFMSINRRKAADLILSELTILDKADLIEKLILHDPTKNCEIRSPQEEMDKIPKNKSLFHAKEGYGLPIGNFYSQLTANAYLGSVDALAKNRKWKGKVGYTRFVDDMCVVADTPETINAFFRDVEKELKRLELRLNNHKKYMQPVRHGVSFCGKTIHAHGIYINNRTVHACQYRLNECPEGIGGAKEIIRSLNSYFGFFVHCKAFKIQQRIAKEVKNKYGKYIKQRIKHGQIIFSVADRYSDKAISYKRILEYLKSIKKYKYDIRKNDRRCHASCRGRGWQGSRWQAYRSRVAC